MRLVPSAAHCRVRQPTRCRVRAARQGAARARAAAARRIFFVLDTSCCHLKEWLTSSGLTFGPPRVERRPVAKSDFEPCVLASPRGVARSGLTTSRPQVSIRWLVAGVRAARSMRMPCASSVSWSCPWTGSRSGVRVSAETREGVGNRDSSSFKCNRPLASEPPRRDIRKEETCFRAI